MRFTCARSVLQEALTLVSSIVPARSTKPILQNICFCGTEDGQLELLVTDLEVGLRYTVDVEELTDPETVVLPAVQVSNIVRDAWGASITLETEDHRAKVITENAEFEVAGESAEEFPAIPDIGGDETVEFRAEELDQAIHRVLFATARDEQQYALAGVYACFEKNKLELVTTDTFRLALAKVTAREGEAEQNSIVLAKGMRELQRLLEGEELVRVRATDSQFFAATSRATLVSRLIEGKFPAYRNVIPKSLDRTVTVDRVRMLEALRQAAHLANPETRAVIFTAREGTLELSASSAQGSRARIELAAEVEGGEVTVSFNYTYLQDVLKVLLEDNVTLHLHDRESPARIDVKDYTYVVSPVYSRDNA
jgi:DNA polymerase-3 subunit beta